MKTENILTQLKFMVKKKCDRNDIYITEIQDEMKSEENNNHDLELDSLYKLNFQLIDIDKVFEN